MREINNNLNNVNFKGVQKPVTEETVTPETAPVQNSEKTEIKDLSKMPSASLGKSQVAASDSIENDMKVFAKNPELTEKLNALIDEYAKTHTQEETIKFMDSAINEFFAKK